MVHTIEIKSFENLLTVGTKLGLNWFRGQSKDFGGLTPSIQRKEIMEGVFHQFNPNYENDLFIEFQQYAHTLITNLPNESDNITWLLWMQHYGVATRLLDWSENILVSAFFATIDHPKDDGEIWTIYPASLNEKSWDFAIPTSRHEIIKLLSDKPFRISDEEKRANNLKNEVYPIAFQAPYIFPRMSAQHSAFTIHSDPSLRIEDAIDDKKYLTKYIIPKHLKPKIREKLRYIGINYRTLFPDLNGLSKFFKEERKYLGWGQPPPPEF